VPVSTTYNQWTQFEDFPLFMEGVEHVEQKDDTRLHWVAKVGGKTNEWDAKILEQHPDKRSRTFWATSSAARSPLRRAMQRPRMIGSYLARRTSIRRSCSSLASSASESWGMDERVSAFVPRSYGASPG